MRTGVSLSVTCVNRRVRDQLQSVLAPDNVGGPEGMRFSMNGEGVFLKFLVRSETPATSLSTAISLLKDISLFQEVWLLSRQKDA